MGAFTSFAAVPMMPVGQVAQQRMIRHATRAIFRHRDR
jgi:hypothetical protein